MIKNNRFTDDTQDERIERLGLLSANIGVYGPMIGVPAPKIAMAETAHGDYVGAIATAGVEDGQMDEAFETLAQAVEALAKYYSLVRAHLQEIIWDFDKPDDFVHGYGFEGKSPTWLAGLESKIEQWKENHDVLVAAGDPRVIPDSVMTELVDKRNDAVALRALAHAEKRESSFAYDALQELYANHTKLLRFILTAAHLVWGDEDPRLVELGFQTASGVHTPGEPDPSLDWPLWPGPARTFIVAYLGMKEVQVDYSGVKEATHGLLHRRIVGTEDWIVVDEELPMTPEGILPLRERDVPPGMWEYRFTPVKDGIKGEPSYAIVEVVV